MKKFKFPLGKVLEFKTHLQKKETDALALLRAEYDRLVEEDVRLYDEYGRAKRLYAETCEAGTSVMEASVVLKYVAQLQEMLKAQKKRIAEKKTEVDRQSERLLAVTQEKMAIEKLKDKHLAVYNEEQRKSEEKYIEEFIANKNAASL